MGSFIILVAGIIFDFHKSWSVGFARLLCSAGTMAIPQPPALPSITIPTNNDTTPNLCVWAPLNDNLGKSHLNHNRWVMTDRNMPWVMPTENVSSVLSLFVSSFIYLYSAPRSCRNSQLAFIDGKAYCGPFLSNTLSVDTSFFVELHFWSPQGSSRVGNREPVLWANIWEWNRQKLKYYTNSDLIRNQKLSFFFNLASLFLFILFFCSVCVSVCWEGNPTALTHTPHTGTSCGSILGQLGLPPT